MFAYSTKKATSFVLTGNFLSPQKRKLAFELLFKLLDDLTRYFDNNYDNKTSTERKDKKEWSTGLKRTLQSLPPQVHKHAV